MTDAVQTMIPHLVVSPAGDAIDFYQKAFGATEVMRVPAEDGERVLHAELRVNGIRIFLRDDFPEAECQHGARVTAPTTLHGTSIVLHLEVADCDTAVQRAADAGARVAMKPWDAFWGARFGMIEDPFGHVWSFAHPLPAKPN
ncbi:VOC family protein [Bradyrhizobium sp. WD16]|uniref:VOC family protein n=1 Tax=Bradyrhizobium sp. WD16 TaxID=1521768 RepID=UPI0020A5BD1E|nr:VOC family protein [Bradyrhizobium sp. WD16]UTD25804.1 glyoxalase [Bradyrhizobium sp. WD16]